MALPEPTDDGPRTDIFEAVRRGVYLGLAATFGAALEADEPVVRPARHVARHEVAVLVGFLGRPAGQIQLGLTREAALGWARRAAGEPFEGLDHGGARALLDAMGVVVGAIANELARQGIVTRFTEPLLALDPAHVAAWPHLYVQEQPLHLPEGSGLLSIGLEVSGDTSARWLDAFDPEPALDEAGGPDADGWLVRVVRAVAP